MNKKSKSVIGWKKIAVKDKNGVIQRFILKLEIPNDAKTVKGGFISHKRRANKVKVLAAYSMKGGRVKRQSFRHLGFWDAEPITYRVGRVTKSPRWNGKEDETCVAGIHYFALRFGAETLDAVIYG